MGKKILLTYAWLVFFLFSYQVCPQINSNNSYFPLVVGNTWIYQTKDKVRTDTITVIKTQYVKGILYYAVKDFSAFYLWYRMENNKLFIVDTAAFQLDSTNIKEYLLYNFTTDIGSKWDIPLKDSHLSCSYGAAIELKSHKETVNSPAGIFNNCSYFLRTSMCFFGIHSEEKFANGIGKVFYTVEGFESPPQNYYLVSYDLVTGINEQSIVDGYKLGQNYPNPFNPFTTIKYSIGEKTIHDYQAKNLFSSLQLVSIKIYDLLGREVASLVNEEKLPGHYEIIFDGSHLTSGVYFYQLKINTNVMAKKMISLK